MFTYDNTKKGKQLGVGTSGTVFEYGKNVEGKKPWAVKINFSKNEIELINMLQEIVLGFSCDHPSVLPIVGYSIERNEEFGYKVYIKLPRMQKSLKDVLDQHKTKNEAFKEPELIKHMYSLALALEYIHKKRIVHRDIKPDNILIDYDGNIKLADIGVANFVAEGESMQLHNGANAGTPLYMAPEIPMRGHSLTKKDLYKSDIWSLGIVLVYLCLLKPEPISLHMSLEKKQAILNSNMNKIAEKYSKDFVQLLQTMLNFDHEQRISASDLRLLIEKKYSDLLGLRKEDGVQKFEEKKVEQNQPQAPKNANTNIESIKKELEQKWKGWFLFEPNKPFNIKVNKNLWLTENVIKECVHDTLATLRSHKDNHLKELSINLSKIDQIGDDELEHLSSEIGKNLQHLEHLSLDFKKCMEITDLGIQMFNVKLCPNLKELRSLSLNFSKCVKITNSALNELSFPIGKDLQKLESLSLDLSGCEEIDDGGLMIFTVNLQEGLLSLKHLSLNFTGCSKIRNDGINNLAMYISERHNKLESLTFGFPGSELVADAHIDYFMSNLTSNLKKVRSISFNFEGCTEITHKAVENIGERIRSDFADLTHLSLSFARCYDVNDRALELLWAQLGGGLNTLTNLTLNLDNCSDITTKGILILSQAIRGLPNLKELSFSFKGLKCFKGDEMLALCTALVNLHKLSLNFSECSGISNTVLSTLSSQLQTKLTGLKELSLGFKECKDISDKDIAALGTSIGGAIKGLTYLSLDFSRCGLITDDGVQNLLFGLSSNLDKLLQLSLSFRDCRRITVGAMVALYDQQNGVVKNLVQLSLDFRGCNEIKLEHKRSLKKALKTKTQLDIVS